ncbi:MAG: DUF3445 domain-containing protein [Deltaproteobacteria bacterium]|nr:DUF3445 domain-containing protein [Deltaproteobacteria bacterium]
MAPTTRRFFSSTRPSTCFARASSPAATTGESALFCRLTGETLRFDAEMKLIPDRHGYESAFDALAMQVQEDLNVISVGDDGSNWLSAIHVCSPSTWRPEEKVGKDFIGIHSPVPTSEAMLRASKGIVNAMVHKGPYVRFNWGLTTRPEPNHHPDEPRGKPVKTIAQGTETYMWVERQIVWGRPAVNAALFTIRILFTPLRELRADAARRAQFLASLASMAPEVREYKGLDDCYDEVVAFMQA